ncbi:MAG: ROK family transcriptional regulator [Armatimonadetes bacterium]|nr:ROK family transcriptional regulator [Armatimonadota bacterium]
MPAPNPFTRNRRTSTSNGLAVRCMNLQAALNVLHNSGPLTGPEIGRVLEVYPSTVKRLLETLEDAGLVQSTLHTGDAQVGRPPKRWALRGEAGYAVGIHIDPKVLRAVVVDLSGQVCRRETLRPSPALTTATLPLRAHELIRSATADIPHQRILGLGVGMGGVVDPESGMVTRAASLRDEAGASAMDYPLQAALAELVPWPIHVANDANVGTLAIFRRLVRAGAVTPDGSLFYLFLTEHAGGIGSGLVLRGQPYTGAHGAAGEIMVPGRALHEPEIRDLWATAVAGDRGARRAVLELRRPMIAHATALCQTLDPDCVVLGGEFTALEPDAVNFVRELLTATPDYWGYLDQPPAQGVVTDPLWPDTIAVGAAELVLEDLFRRPAPGEVGPLVTLAIGAEPQG